LLAVTAACNRGGPKPAAAIGEAYVGPAVLNIRADIPPQSPTVTTAKHGDKLAILGRRRRYLRVRTPSGAEGWTDERQLLASEEMASLRDLAKRAAAMPVQGRATTFGELNVHTQPSRQAPSFLVVKENEKVDVLAQVSLPRTDPPRKPLIPPAEKKKAAAKKPPKPPKIPPIPMPKPPPVPENWLELSKTDLGDEGPDEAPEAPSAKPVPADSWTLVRVDSGHSGWVLSRRLAMAIPDDVAQYAEGRRIVSYFPLGAVDDGGEKKQMWLWTTTSGGHTYDFDSIRVFSWGLRKHRYETAYIDRNVNGFSPVLLREVEFGKEKYPGFSVCVEKKDGTRARREYAVMDHNTVRFAGELPCEPPASPMTLAPPAEIKTAEAAADSAPSFTERLTRRVKGWFKKK
jgi:hypothetical protein